LKISAVIAEYNPFHNGHRYHLERTLENGAGHIIAIMSGNFVQRGESAIMDAGFRAKQALLNGVSAVIQLPLPWAVAGAEKFAFGGVYIANAMGCADTLSFGSESGDTEPLEKIAGILLSGAIDEKIRDGLKNGASYPAARQRAAGTLGGGLSAVLGKPNDILAVEYIKALKTLKSKIAPFAVKREGVLHDSDTESGDFLSASEIRRRILYDCINYKEVSKTPVGAGLVSALDLHLFSGRTQGPPLQNEDYCDYMPPNSFEILENAVKSGSAPSDFRKLETAILAGLRKAKKDDIMNLPDVSEGLENRILSVAASAKSLDGLYDTIKTKRYAHSRIRRIILCHLLGVTRDIYDRPPPYIRVLGAAKAGEEVLRIMKKTASLPILSKTADISKLDEFGRKIFALEAAATDLYGLTLPEIALCGAEYTRRFIKVE